MSRNRRVVIACSLAIATMTMLVAFSLPLYRAFCEATGIGGTTRRVSGEAAAAALQNESQNVEVRFNTDVAPDLPWRFEPVQRSVTAILGKPTLVRFWAENESDQAIVAHATYNVTPDLAGRYFNKIQCFCFNEERLAAHQRVEMPVLFFVDAAMLQDHDIGNLPAITLSYTFFRSTNPDAAKDLGRFGATAVVETPLRNGDADRGARIFAAQCTPCHALDHNKAGPSLGGVDGRHAGQAPGFRYSSALAAADIVWGPKTLDAWLTDPREDVPGAMMPVTVHDPQTRADVIAYLMAQPTPQTQNR